MSFLELSRWKPRHLLAAWSAYWAGLALVTLGPAALAILRVTVPKGAKGSVAANFGDAGLELVVKSAGVTTWFGQASVVSVALWLAAPPLLLWIAWLATRPARRHDAQLDDRPVELLRDAPISLHDRERPKEERVDRKP
jgi:threonine/homoserine/homoserine lactone efflux protein